MAGYYVFMLAIRVPVHLSVSPSVVCTSVCTSFLLDNLGIFKWISFKFCICICTNSVSLWIVNFNNFHRVMALVNIQKKVFGL